MKVSHSYQEKSRLGRLLVNRGYLSEVQLDQALRSQRETGQRLGEALIQAGWVSERELHRVLKHQTRYRNAAALVAAVTLPFQPLVSFASTNSSDSGLDTVIGQEYEGGMGGLSPMSEQEMSDVTAQGTEQFLARIGAVSSMANDASAGQSPDEMESGAMQGLNMLAHTFVPIMSFLDSDFSITGVHYNPEKPRMEFQQDGGVKVALPDRIEEIRMDNIRVSGSSGPSMGNVSIHDIQFHPESSMTIYTR